jgi:mannose-1-phosphate guanylyltransferase / mannose-6-phosphate isomerase
MKIIPVILSGGAGTRLWPISRQAKPKQFLKFGTGHALIQETLLRCRADFFDERPIVVAADADRFLIAEALREIGVQADIVLEPVRRDSCAAIVAGTFLAQQRDPAALIMVMAADHYIPDSAAFVHYVGLAVSEAQAGRIVTFGVRPDGPATGYGYIQRGEKSGSHCFKVKSFREKPDRETAERLIREDYLWNSGNVIFRSDIFLDETQTFEPGILGAVRDALNRARRDKDFIRLHQQAFSASPQKSVDFAVMEKTDKAVVLPVDYPWSDIGSWDAVADGMTADASGNVIEGHSFIAQSSNSYLRSDGIFTAVIGCDDIVVITTHDAVLVTKRRGTEKVKDLVGLLKSAGVAEAE